MISATTIRQDLKEIRHYFSHRDLFDEVSSEIGTNSIMEKVKKYNRLICKAPPKLYELYVMLYVRNYTQESGAEAMNLSCNYIQKLNTDLIKFFQKEYSKEVQDNG